MKTQKFDNLRSSSTIRMIFSSSTSSITTTCSFDILVGEAAIAAQEIHASRHPGYEHFILGSEIAVLSCNIDEARVCSLGGEIQTWAAP